MEDNFALLVLETENCFCVERFLKLIDFLITRGILLNKDFNILRCTLVCPFSGLICQLDFGIFKNGKWGVLLYHCLYNHKIYRIQKIT